jgi:leucyl aminopeptidase
MTISFRAASAPDDSAVRVVGARADRLDEDLPPADRAALDAQGFTGAVGEARLLGGDDGLRVVAGLGPAADVDPRALRRAGAAAARAARRLPSASVDVLGLLPEDGRGPAGAQALVEGMAAGTYRYDRFRSTDRGDLLAEVVVVGRGGQRLQKAVERGARVADAVALARDLVNEPGGSLTPPVLADRAAEVAGAAGLKATVLDEDGIRAQGLGGLLGVNRGSEQPPRFVELAWEPERPRGSVALVGKGITFDAGGLSIKTTEGMSAMKGDMGGAAAVIGAMSVVPELAPRVKVVGYLPITDNMLGPDATRVGDVLEIRGGTTVEVMNTDAEGRLVLADAIVKAGEARPDAIVDLATLTGACEVALGSRTAGLMGTHAGLVDQVQAAADGAGEDVWPLPMPAHLRRQLDSDVADLRNVGTTRYGGALIAAHFLSRFVADGIPWAHLDIAGPAWSREDDVETPKGGTGFGVRLLLQLLADWKRPR